MTSSSGEFLEMDMTEEEFAADEGSDRPKRGSDDALAFPEEVLAQTFIDEHLADLRYTALWGQWLTWDGNRWVPDDRLATFSMVRQLCYEQARRAVSRAKASPARARSQPSGVSPDPISRSP